MPRKILLIDGLNQYIRNFVCVGIVNDNGEFFGGVFGTLQTVKHLVEIFTPNIVIWCWEGRNSGKRRRELFNEYKAGRKTRGSISRAYEFASIEEERENFKKQLLKVKDYFSLLPIYQMEIENLEADDVIAYIANNLFKEDEKIIISSDRDYLQLVNDKIRVYRPVKKQIIKTEDVLNEFDTHPKNLAISRAITGDKSDEIPQLLKGLGPKKVAKLFPFLKEDNIYTIDDLIKYAEERKEDEKYKIFLEQKSIDIVKRNFDLIQLRNYEIDSTSVDKIRSNFIFQKPVLSTSQLMILFLKDSLHSQIKRYDTWHRLFLRLNKEFNPLNNENDIA